MSLPAFRSHLHGLWDGVYVGGCQNFGPLLGTLNVRCRTIQGTQKGTIILTTTHVRIRAHIVQYSMCPVMYNTIHTHVQIYVICTYVHTCMHIHAYTHIHLHAPIRIHIHIHAHTCASVYIYIYTHVETRTYYGSMSFNAAVQVCRASFVCCFALRLTRTYSRSCSARFAIHIELKCACLEFLY